MWTGTTWSLGVSNYVLPIAATGAAGGILGGVIPTQYLIEDSKGHISVDPSLVSRLVTTEARLARYQADFVNSVYTVNGASSTLAQAVPLGAQNLDGSGRLLVQRAATNLIINPLFGGAKKGPYDQGGVFPTSWERSAPAVPWEIVSFDSSKIRIRFWRVKGGPGAGATFGMRSPYTVSVAPSRGGLVGSCQVRIVSATENFGVSYLQVNNITTGVTGFGAQFLADNTLRSYSAYVGAQTAQSFYFSVQFSLTGAGANTDPFEIIFDLYYPQLEDGKSPMDYTAYVPSMRDAYQTTLALPAGSPQAVTLQSSNRGDWYKADVQSNSVWTVPIPDEGYLAVEKIYSMDDNGVTVARETEFSSTMFPPAFSQPYIATDVIDQSRLRWTVQGAIGLTYNYLRGSNKKLLERFEVRQGDCGWWETDHPVERSELSCQTSLAYGVEVWVSFGLLIEPGDVNNTSWVSLIQFHGNPQPTDANYNAKLSWSPCFTLDFRQDTLTIATRSESKVSASGTPIEVILYEDPNYQRGVVQYWVGRFVLMQTGSTGQLQLWKNGAEILNLVLPNAYNDGLGPYLKYGIYRGTVPPPLAVQFANMEVSYQSLADRIANPLVVA